MKSYNFISVTCYKDPPPEGTEIDDNGTNWPIR